MLNGGHESDAEQLHPLRHGLMRASSPIDARRLNAPSRRGRAKEAVRSDMLVIDCPHSRSGPACCVQPPRPPRATPTLMRGRPVPSPTGSVWAEQVNAGRRRRMWQYIRIRGAHGSGRRPHQRPDALPEQADLVNWFDCTGCIRWRSPVIRPPQHHRQRLFAMPRHRDQWAKPIRVPGSSNAVDPALRRRSSPPRRSRHEVGGVRTAARVMLCFAG